MSSDKDDAEVVREEKEVSMHGTTARVTIEIESDGGLSDENRRELAVALLEEGMNTEFADWDHNHPVPTYDGRVI